MRLPPKTKPAARPAWTGYWVLARRAFEDDGWLRRWLRLKEELRVKVPR